jgi:hypothetical protein
LQTLTYFSEEDYLADEYAGGSGSDPDADRTLDENAKNEFTKDAGTEDYTNQFGDERQEESSGDDDNFDNKEEDDDDEQDNDNDGQDEEVNSYIEDYCKRNGIDKGEIDKNNFKQRRKEAKKIKDKEERKEALKTIEKDRRKLQNQKWSAGQGRKLDSEGPVNVEWLYKFWRKCLFHPMLRELCKTINTGARTALQIATGGAGYVALCIVKLKIHFDTVGGCLDLIDSPILTFIPVKGILDRILAFPLLQIPLKVLKKIATPLLSYTDYGLVNLANKAYAATNALQLNDIETIKKCRQKCAFHRRLMAGRKGKQGYFASSVARVSRITLTLI